jgi:hypothetical protein
MMKCVWTGYFAIRCSIVQMFFIQIFSLSLHAPAINKGQASLLMRVPDHTRHNPVHKNVKWSVSIGCCFSFT